MDVKSLNINIPKSQRIAITKRAFDKQTNKTIATKVKTTFLARILTLKNFIYNWQNYLQTQRCAIGTICASSHANIFIGKFESKYIYTSIKNTSVLYLRFIDTYEQFQIILKQLNEQHLSIKFDYKISKKKLDF